MHDVDAFEEQVSAYPAITVIRRGEQGPAVVANATADFDEKRGGGVHQVGRGTKSSSRRHKALTAVKLSTWFDSIASWPSGNPANLALLADLERRFPPLEDPATGTRVGIGVATGADSVYLTEDPDLVEPDRLLPMLTTRDTNDGVARWSGTYIVNPWRDGGLVSLDDYPRMARYLESWNGEVRGRHVALKNPGRWYRTIDRVEPGLLERDKLVIPDLKAFIHPVLDRGETYPHHSFYFVTSDNGTSRCSAACSFRTSPSCSSACTASRCAAAATASRPSTSGVSACPRSTQIGKRDAETRARAFEVARPGDGQRCGAPCVRPRCRPTLEGC